MPGLIVGVILSAMIAGLLVYLVLVTTPNEHF